MKQYIYSQVNIQIYDFLQTGISIATTYRTYKPLGSNRGPKYYYNFKPQCVPNLCWLTKSMNFLMDTHFVPGKIQ